jgi:hypothetical protein
MATAFCFWNGFIQVGDSVGHLRFGKPAELLVGVRDEGRGESAQGPHGHSPSGVRHGHCLLCFEWFHTGAFGLGCTAGALLRVVKLYVIPSYCAGSIVLCIYLTLSTPLWISRSDAK